MIDVSKEWDEGEHFIWFSHLIDSLGGEALRLYTLEISVYRIVLKSNR